jgi:hypothetical protein
MYEILSAQLLSVEQISELVLPKMLQIIKDTEVDSKWVDTLMAIIEILPVEQLHSTV